MANVLIVTASAASDTGAEDLADPLRRGGHRVLRATGGREAVAHLGRHRPDLIIAGLSVFCQECLHLMTVLTTPSWRDVPIVLYSGRCDPGPGAGPAPFGRCLLVSRGQDMAADTCARIIACLHDDVRRGRDAPAPAPLSMRHVIEMHERDAATHLVA